MRQKRLVVIGGGAAGFFCAVNAARMNRRLQVILVEKSSRLLSKVKISGGGRCNVTHHCFSISDMVKRYPRGAGFLKKAFHHFFTTDTIQWFKERGVLLKTEDDGRMFPTTDTSQTIIDCLLNEAKKYKVEIVTNFDVTAITQEEVSGGAMRSGNAPGWKIEARNSAPITAGYICIACGGFPKEGQFDWLMQAGHTIEKPVPSLFTFNIPGSSITELMGIAVKDCVIKLNGTKLASRGPVLITHWGLSGPAVLKLSAFAARELAASGWQHAVSVNWLGEFNEHTLREKFEQLTATHAARKMANCNVFGLPNRLWQQQLTDAGIDEDSRFADLPAAARNKLIKNLCGQEFLVKGKTTFKEEFVTAGGISLNEIDHNTMQSKLKTGLYFAGEVINVDGVTGGFNFQNAWTTGWIAANAIAMHANRLQENTG